MLGAPKERKDGGEEEKGTDGWKSPDDAHWREREGRGRKREEAMGELS